MYLEKTLHLHGLVRTFSCIDTSCVDVLVLYKIWNLAIPGSIPMPDIKVLLLSCRYSLDGSKVLQSSRIGGTSHYVLQPAQAHPKNVHGTGGQMK